MTATRACPTAETPDGKAAQPGRRLVARPRPARRPAACVRAPGRSLKAWWLDLAGGPVRARVVFLLACVLGLDNADLGSVGATAGQLEHALSLTNTELGLLAAAPAICAAVATLPMGVLVDRSCRVRLLWITMLAWSVTEALSGVAPSFEVLLLIRLGLGAATAVAFPAVASLVGDLFSGGERGRIWGLILSGELIGSAFGFLIAGEAATLGGGSWRYAFFVLAIPSLLGAGAIRRRLREPARGGGSCLEPGATEFTSAEPTRPESPASEGDAFQETKAQEKVEERGVEPFPALVLHVDPEAMSLAHATRYILRVRTNVVLIIASALGYFYFTGVSTFGLVFFAGRYHVSHGLATLLFMLLGLGGLAGVILGGRLADRWLGRGHVNSRIVVGAVSFALAALLLLPAILARSVAVALPLFILAGFAFGAHNPPLDAARLDIMHHRLWGRAEAVRTLLRRSTTATAPVLFGLLADALVAPGAPPASGTQGFGAGANAHGLQIAFLILLVTLALGGILTLLATRTYPRDVATALASELNATTHGRAGQPQEAA